MELRVQNEAQCFLFDNAMTILTVDINLKWLSGARAQNKTNHHYCFFPFILFY